MSLRMLNFSTVASTCSKNQHCQGDEGVDVDKRSVKSKKFISVQGLSATYECNLGGIHARLKSGN